MDNATPYRKTLRLVGFVNVYSVERRGGRDVVNSLGYSQRQPPCWKFYIKFTQAGADPRAPFGHYGLNLITSSEQEAARIAERLEELRESRQILSFDAPVSFTNWTNQSTLRFACGATVGLPLEALFVDPSPQAESLPSEDGAESAESGQEDAPSAFDPEELLASLDRLTIPLRGTVSLFSVEARQEGRARATPRGYQLARSRPGWKLHILFVEEGCSPTGTIGRHGLNFYTDSRQESNYLQRALSWLIEQKTLLDIAVPVNYYEWMDKATGAFRCGSSLDLPLEIVDYYPD